MILNDFQPTDIGHTHKALELPRCPRLQITVLYLLKMGSIFLFSYNTVSPEDLQMCQVLKIFVTRLDCSNLPKKVVI